MCFNENCRVSLEQSFPFLKFYFNLPAYDLVIARNPSPFSSFPFTHLPRKSCICHPYENCRVNTNNSILELERRATGRAEIFFTSHKLLITSHLPLYHSTP